MKGSAGSLLVVNIRGTINIPSPMKKTLEQLGLKKRFHAAIVPDNPVYRGMLTNVKNYVAWWKLDAELAEKILQKRGRTVGWRPLTGNDVKNLKFRSFKEMAETIERGEILMLKKKPVKMLFGLHPPKGGFKKSTRRMFSQGGVLGENPELPKLVESML